MKPMIGKITMKTHDLERYLRMGLKSSAEIIFPLSIAKGLGYLAQI